MTHCIDRSVHVALYLRQYDALAKAIAEVDQQVMRRRPDGRGGGEATLSLADGSFMRDSGFVALAGKTSSAEIGTDLARFPAGGVVRVAANAKSSRLRKTSPAQDICGQCGSGVAFARGATARKP